MHIEAREAVRAVIVAERRLVLLMQMAFPWREQLIWVAPGGGVLAGEAPLDALRRELVEELGRADLPIGPFLFERTFDIERPARVVRQHETYHLVECPRFVPDPRAMEVKERGYFRGFEWWALAALAAEPGVAAGLEIVAAVEGALATS